MFSLNHFLNDIKTEKDKANGVIFTPLNVAKLLVELANPTLEETIVEPSVGKGHIIFVLLEHISEKYQLNASQLWAYFNQKITCLDINEEYLSDFKENIAKYFLLKFGEVVPTDFVNIYCQDSLVADHKQYDIAIGNPPYIRIQNLDTDYKNWIKQNYQTTSVGNSDIYFAFIERFLACSKKMAFVTPNGFLTSKSGKTIRDLVIKQAKTIINIKQDYLFPDAQVHCALFLTEADTQDSIYYTTQLPTVSELQTKTGFELINKLNFHVDLNQRKQNKNKVLSGIATLFDKGYIVFKDEIKGYYAINPITLERFEIESDLVIEYVKITDLEKKRFIIFPYYWDSNLARYVIYNEEEMEQKFPKTLSYLYSIKERLGQRDKGKTEGYESWYAYGRRQGLHKLKGDTITFIPQMLGENTKINTLKRSQLPEHFVFTSGYVIENIEHLNLETQHKTLFEYASEIGKYYQGNYFSITSKQTENYYG